MKLVLVHPAASAEANDAIAWYRRKSIPAALGFYTELRSAFEAISHEVSASVPYLAGTRRKLLDRYPYFVVFREESEAIQVIAVAHGRRLPGYWKNRV